MAYEISVKEPATGKEFKTVVSELTETAILKAAKEYTNQARK